MNSKNLFKNGVSLLLSSLFFVGGGQLVAASLTYNSLGYNYTYGVSLNDTGVSNFCKQSHNKKLCSYHKQYASQKKNAWERYDAANWNPERVEYWQLSPAELFDKYENVTQDIGYLWNKNPEYVDGKIKSFIRKWAISVNVTAAALIGGYVVGGVLAGAGFRVAGNMASIVPVGSAVVHNGVRMSVQSALHALATNILRGKFWAETGLTMLVLVGDGLMVEGAFYTFYTLDTELSEPLAENNTMKSAIKARELIHEITNPPLSGGQKADLAKSEDKGKQNKELFKQLRQAVEKQFEQGGWGSDEDTAFMAHREAVVMLYALEYLRAEMSDLRDGLRFRRAAVDLAQIYFGSDITELYDRAELNDMLKQAMDAQKEKERAKTEQALKNKDWTQSQYWNRFGAHK